MPSALVSFPVHGKDTMNKIEYPDPISKILGPSWCFVHGCAVPCLQCDEPCSLCNGYGETENSRGAGMAGANPNCPMCDGSGLAGRLGKLLLHPRSWKN